MRLRVDGRKRILGTLRNRRAGRLMTAEWRKNVARDCAFPVLRDVFIRHSAVLSLPAVLLRKVPNFVSAVKTLTSNVSASLLSSAFPRWRTHECWDCRLKSIVHARSVYDIVLCVYERFRVDVWKRYVNDDRFRVDGDKNMRLLAFAFTIAYVWTGS